MSNRLKTRFLRSIAAVVIMVSLLGGPVFIFILKYQQVIAPIYSSLYENGALSLHCSSCVRQRAYRP